MNARDAGVAALVAFVMLGAGLGLRPSDLAGWVRRPAVVLRVLFAEHVVLPIVAVGLAEALGLPPPSRTALVICAAVPGGPIGPAFATMARGSVALAVTLVVASAVINVGSVPLTLTVVSTGLPDGGAVARALVGTILALQICPLALGMAVHAARPELAQRLRSACDRAGQVIIAALVVGMVWTQWRTLATLDGAAVAGLLALSVIGIAIAWAAAGPVAEHRAAAATTSGIRNLGLGLLVATRVFHDGDRGLIEVMIFGLTMMGVTAIVAHGLGRRPLSGEV